MAVQAGCGFKPSTPAFAMPLPVTREPPRRLGVTPTPIRDTGSDVIVGGRLSGQWVTMSKTLLLQLVERICQLSFQNDVMTSSNASSPQYRKSSDELGPESETESFRRRFSSADGGESPPERASEKDNGQDVMKDEAAAEDCQTPVRQENAVLTLPARGQTTSGSAETSADERLLAVSCRVGDQNSTVELEMVDASSSVDKEFSGTVIEADRGPSDASTSDENHLVDRRRQHHQRYHRSSCRHRLLRARRRKKAALATSGGQVRCQVATNLGDDADGRRPHLHGVRRSRQSWMALSKDIVYGAVENELRQVDRSRRPVIPAASSPAKSAAIWNPATCLSPSEKRRSRPSDTNVECAPPRTGFRYRTAAFHQTGSDAVRQPCDATLTRSSSMLSELLGFGAATPTVVLPTLPAEVVLTRQRHCSYSGGETSVCSVMSPSSVSGSGVKEGPRSDHAHSRSVSESPSHDDVTTALDYCIRRDTGNRQDGVAFSSVPRIWRPVESYPVQSIARRVTRPRWVAVDKGDVCSLVDSLVSTMIASEDCSSGTSTDSRPGDVRDASTPVDTTQPTVLSSLSATKPVIPVSARCTVAASEPRKWKSDLLQRMRNEDT